MTKTEYPTELAAVIALQLSQHLDEGAIIAKELVVLHEEENEDYTMVITYKRRGGSSC